MRLHLFRRAGLRRGLARIMVGLLGLAISFAAAVVLLLALKVDPGAVQSISGYRSAYDHLAGLRASDATDATRLVTGPAGLAAFVLLGASALVLLPRPYRAAAPITLAAAEDGCTTVLPRVVERAARIAAELEPVVRDASARFADGHLDVGIVVERGDDLGGTLTDVDAAIRESIARHALPAPTVRVTVTRYRPSTTRELR